MPVSKRSVGLPLLVLLTMSMGLQGCGIFRGSSAKPNTAGERISVLDYENLVEAEAELQDVAIVLPATTVNDGWTQPGGSASGVMGHLALSPNPTQQWRVSIGRGSDKTRRLNSVPVILANRLFTMDTAGDVTAFDATTGKQLWRREINVKSEGDRPAFGGGVSVAGDRVYATTGYGIVAAFDAATGNEIWRQTFPTPLRAAPAVEGGRIFIMGQDSQLSALDADTGETLWQANATIEPASLLGPGAPAVALGTAVAGFPSGELFALRVENGRTAWQDHLGRTARTTALGALSAIVASPVIDRGRVFAIGHGGRIVALELATGQRVWEREFAGVNTPWSVADWVFVVTVESELVALTRADGKIRWVAHLERWKNPDKKTGPVEWFGPVLAGDRLYLVSSEKRMVAVSPHTGEVLRETKINAPAYLPPVVANGMLYVLTDDGSLTAYR